MSGWLLATAACGLISPSLKRAKAGGLEGTPGQGDSVGAVNDSSGLKNYGLMGIPPVQSWLQRLYYFIAAQNPGPEKSRECDARAWPVEVGRTSRNGGQQGDQRFGGKA